MHPDPPRQAATDSPLTEVVNIRTGAIRVTGDLSAAGAQTICGTVRSLHRAGHENVVLDLAGVHAVHDDARSVLEQLRQRLSDSRARLHVLWGPTARDGTAGTPLR